MKRLVIFFAALILAACTTLVKPANLEERAVYAKGVQQAMYGTIANLVSTGRLDPDRAASLVERVDLAGVLIDQAWGYARTGRSVDLSTGTRILESAEQALQEINRILTEGAGHEHHSSYQLSA